MKMRLLCSVLSFAVLFEATAFDPNLLTNNKEVRSLALTKKARRAANKLATARDSSSLAKLTKDILDETVSEFNERSASCDLGFYDLFMKKALDAGAIASAEELPSLLAFMRVENQIDDILYKILLRSDELIEDLGSARIRNNSASKRDLDEVSESGLNLNEAYSEFKSWPNEVSKCSLGRFGQLMTNIGGVRGKYFYNKMERFNRVALSQGVISDEVFRKLQVLASEKALDWDHYIKGYFEVVANAKDKLKISEDETTPREETEEYVSRRHKLTERGRLYKTYDSTQIMMLAGVIQKAARRMDASQVTINFQFTPENPSDTEIYVLSPMERYRLAIKMIRKDMGDLMKSETFGGITIEYEDLVTAAYETGLIKSEELDYILKFEEMWNPTVPRWKKYAGLAFSLVGTASFYLPPPWNIIGAIGLVVTQTKVMNMDNKPSSDDNWNSVI